MASESLPNDSSNISDNAEALANDALNTVGIGAQTAITRGARGLFNGIRDVINPDRNTEEGQVRAAQVRQAALRQGYRLASDGVQALLYSIGGVPGFVYKGLRVLLGDKAALYALGAVFAFCLILVLWLVNLGIESTNNPTKFIGMAIGCKIQGKSDAQCAASDLLSKASQFAEVDTCGAIAERTGKPNIDCKNLGVSDN